MRRTITIRPENQLALALAEIERLKAITTRVTDGRVIVTIPGTTPDDGHIGDGDLPPIETSAHILYGSKHTNSFLVTAAEGISLIVRYQAGQTWQGGNFITAAAGTLLMTDATTNYVFVLAGVVATNATGFPLTSTPLAEVITGGGTITSVNDRRSYLLPGAGTSGSLHDADQIISADGATSVEVERTPIDDIIRLRAASVDVAQIGVAGQWQLPITGVGAGILLGGDVQIYRGGVNELFLNAVRVIIPDGGLLRIGNDAAVSFGGNVSLSFLGTGLADTRMGFGYWADNAASASMIFLKSRDTVIGSQTIVQDDDVLGLLVWSADDGVDNSSHTAWILSKIEGTPGVGDTPGALFFYTTPPGFNTPQERMSISPVGMLRLNLGGPTGGIRIAGDVSLFRLSGGLLGTGHTVIGGVGSAASRSVLNVTATSNPVGRSLIEAHIRSTGANDLAFRVTDFGDGYFWRNLVVDGDLTFGPDGSGLPYGHMYGHDIAETVGVGAVDTWYELTAGLSGGEVNLETFANSHELAVTNAGRYLIIWNLSMRTSVANDEIEGTIGINNTADPDHAAHVTMAKANADESMGGSGIHDLAAGDVVSVFVAQHSAIRDIVVEHVTVSVVMVGGT